MNKMVEKNINVITSITIKANICLDSVRPTRYAKFNNNKENINPIDNSTDI